MTCSILGNAVPPKFSGIRVCNLPLKIPTWVCCILQLAVMGLLPGSLILASSVFMLVLPISSAPVAEEMSFTSARNTYLISVQVNFKLPLQLNNSPTNLSCQTRINKGKEKMY